MTDGFNQAQSASQYPVQPHIGIVTRGKNIFLTFPEMTNSICLDKDLARLLGEKLLMHSRSI